MLIDVRNPRENLGCCRECGLEGDFAGTLAALHVCAGSAIRLQRGRRQRCSKIRHRGAGFIDNVGVPPRPKSDDERVLTTLVHVNVKAVIGVMGKVHTCDADGDDRRGAEARSEGARDLSVVVVAVRNGARISDVVGQVEGHVSDSKEMMHVVIHNELKSVGCNALRMKIAHGQTSRRVLVEAGEKQGDARNFSNKLLLKSNPFAFPTAAADGWRIFGVNFAPGVKPSRIAPRFVAANDLPRVLRIRIRRRARSNNRFADSDGGDELLRGRDRGNILHRWVLERQAGNGDSDKVSNVLAVGLFALGGEGVLLHGRLFGAVGVDARDCSVERLGEGSKLRLLLSFGVAVLEGDFGCRVEADKTEEAGATAAASLRLRSARALGGRARAFTARVLLDGGLEVLAGFGELESLRDRVLACPRAALAVDVEEFLH